MVLAYELVQWHQDRIRSVIGSRSLTVTALSTGDSCVISSPTKFSLATNYTGL